jgi:hypothetical protein
LGDTRRAAPREQAQHGRQRADEQPRRVGTFRWLRPDAALG